MKGVRRATVAIALVASLFPAVAVSAETPRSVVAVSDPIMGVLRFFDPRTLVEVQPPLPSRGAQPGELWVESGWLFSANRGAGAGSLGIFDLSSSADGPVTEHPVSPVPIDTSPTTSVSAASSEQGAFFVWTTSGDVSEPCAPDGLVTVLDASGLRRNGTITPAGWWSGYGTPQSAVIGIEHSLYGSPSANEAVVATPCAGRLAHLRVQVPFLDPQVCPHAPFDCLVQGGGVYGTDGVRTNASPKALLYDAEHRLVLTVHERGGISAHAFPFPRPGRFTSLPVDPHPAVATLADAADGRRWLITANGDHTISILDRRTIADCVAVRLSTCDAEVARIFVPIDGSIPEAVAYDPETHRVFVVRSEVPGGTSASLAVVQLVDPGDADDPVDGYVIGSSALGIESLDASSVQRSFDVVLVTPDMRDPP